MDQKTLKALLRQDLFTFIDKSFQEVDGGIFISNWHIEVIAYYLSLVEAGEIKRLIINLPPRGLKSLCASVAFPAWILGRNPDQRVICASYGLDLGIKHGLGTRKIMESSWYKGAFPGLKFGPKQTETLLSTGKSGGRQTISVGGPMTGFGGNVIIIDDPMKVADASSLSKRIEVQEWYSNTLYSRLDNKAEDAIVIVMQRLHEDDLSAYVQELEDWTVLSIPAMAQQDLEYPFSNDHAYEYPAGAVLDEEREPIEILDTIKATLGSAQFSAQYLQKPVPHGGNLIKWHWFKRFDLDDPPVFDAIIQSWDVASSILEGRSYSVCTTWGIAGENVYLIAVYRRRLEAPDLIHAARDLFRLHQPHLILIEKAGPGLALFQHLAGEMRGHCQIWGTTPRGDKALRAELVTPMLERGEVGIPYAAPWLDDFYNEVLGFPAGKYNDQVDSMTQFLHHRDTMIHRANSQSRRRKNTGTATARPANRKSALRSNQVLLEISQRWNSDW